MLEDSFALPCSRRSPDRCVRSWQSSTAASRKTCSYSGTGQETGANTLNDANVSPAGGGVGAERRRGWTMPASARKGWERFIRRRRTQRSGAAYSPTPQGMRQNEFEFEFGYECECGISERLGGLQHPPPSSEALDTSSSGGQTGARKFIERTC